MSGCFLIFSKKCMFDHSCLIFCLVVVDKNFLLQSNLLEFCSSDKTVGILFVSQICLSFVLQTKSFFCGCFLLQTKLFKFCSSDKVVKVSDKAVGVLFCPPTAAAAVAVTSEHLKVLKRLKISKNLKIH